MIVDTPISRDSGAIRFAMAQAKFGEVISARRSQLAETSLPALAPLAVIPDPSNGAMAAATTSADASNANGLTAASGGGASESASANVIGSGDSGAAASAGACVSAVDLREAINSMVPGIVERLQQQQQQQQQPQQPQQQQQQQQRLLDLLYEEHEEQQQYPSLVFMQAEHEEQQWEQQLWREALQLQHEIEQEDRDWFESNFWPVRERQQQSQRLRQPEWLAPLVPQTPRSFMPITSRTPSPVSRRRQQQQLQQLDPLVPQTPRNEVVRIRSRTPPPVSRLRL